MSKGVHLKSKKGDKVKEVWKDITEYEGYYQVSNLGRVRGVDRYVGYKNGLKRLYKGKILKLRSNKYGYMYIKLNKYGNSKNAILHRLVATAFIENKDGLGQVNHIDGNKSNNNVSNLEWCDHSHNQKHAYRTGLNIPRKGEELVYTKLTEIEVLEIRKLYEFTNITQNKIADRYKVSHQLISLIVNKKIWTHI